MIDEIQLCPESTTTLRQLAAFARTWRTAELFGLTCMSATVLGGLLETVDNPVRGDAVGILPEERTAWSSSGSAPALPVRRWTRPWRLPGIVGSRPADVHEDR